MSGDEIQAQWADLVDLLETKTVEEINQLVNLIVFKLGEETQFQSLLKSMETSKIIALLNETANTIISLNADAATNRQALLDFMRTVLTAGLMSVVQTVKEI